MSILISETGLCSRIKSAHKYGYTITGYETQGDSLITIDGGDWIVQSYRELLPRKVLGLLVEHIGYLPENESLRIERKAANQVLMRDVADAPLAEYERIMSQIEGWVLGPIPFIWRDRWQLMQREDLQICAISLNTMTLIEPSRVVVPVQYDDCAVWSMDGERVFARVSTPVAIGETLSVLVSADWRKQEN